MADDVISGYAEALLGIAAAEGSSKEFESELSQVAQAVNSSDELRAALADQAMPAGRRQQIVEELLGGRASSLTTAAVSMVVGAGRGRYLTSIADRVIELAAAERGKVVAEVRSAVPLDPSQQLRLAEALKSSTGSDVEVKVIVDPSIMGGLVTQIGDQIIDGSVRSRLGQLREAF
ncbi:MAG: ATP synthase F1 subunit delta [Acidimicrobiia bacterium]|nr:ATP synthase F1 subunit delta [Acidimicrobiia bacterium]